MSGKLLALDLSGGIGWAVFQAPGPPTFGSLQLRGEGFAAIAGKFHDFLHDRWAVDPWDAIAWEEPFLKPGDKVDKMKILIGLPIIACGFANSVRHKMPFLSVTPKEVKKRMTGRQDADKADVRAACWELGWKVKNDDEADAAGVGLVAYRRIWPKREAA
jgi:hypothetical protein